jgi:hypothetical protein
VEADELFAIVQAAPLGRQEVRDHDRLAIAFGLWHRSTGRLGPCDLAAVVLVKRGLIVTRGLRVLREQLFLRLLLTTCRASA